MIREYHKWRTYFKKRVTGLRSKKSMLGKWPQRKEGTEACVHTLARRLQLHSCPWNECSSFLSDGLAVAVSLLSASPSVNRLFDPQTLIRTLLCWALPGGGREQDSLSTCLPERGCLDVSGVYTLFREERLRASSLPGALGDQLVSFSP